MNLSVLVRIDKVVGADNSAAWNLLCQIVLHLPEAGTGSTVATVEPWSQLGKIDRAFASLVFPPDIDQSTEPFGVGVVFADIRLSLIPDEASDGVISYRIIHSVVHDGHVRIVPPGLLLLAALCVIVYVAISADNFLRQPAFNSGSAPVAAQKADRYVQSLVQQTCKIPGSGTEPSCTLRIAQFPFSLNRFRRGERSGLRNFHQTDSLASCSSCNLFVRAFDRAVPEAVQRHFHI